MNVGPVMGPADHRCASTKIVEEGPENEFQGDQSQSAVPAKRPYFATFPPASFFALQLLNKLFQSPEDRCTCNTSP